MVEPTRTTDNLSTDNLAKSDETYSVRKRNIRIAFLKKTTFSFTLKLLPNLAMYRLISVFTQYFYIRQSLAINFTHIATLCLVEARKFRQIVYTDTI